MVFSFTTGKAEVVLQNGYTRDLSNGIPSNKHTGLVHSNEPGNSTGTSRDISNSNTSTSVCPDIHFTNCSKISAKDNDSKKNNECKNKTVYIMNQKLQEGVTKSHCSRVESSKFKDTSRSPERAPASRKLIMKTSRVSSTDLDSGVSFTDQLTFQDSTSNFPDIAWKDTKSIITFCDSARCDKHLASNRVNDVESLPLHSRMCVLLWAVAVMAAKMSHLPELEITIFHRPVEHRCPGIALLRHFYVWLKRLRTLRLCIMQYSGFWSPNKIN